MRPGSRTLGIAFSDAETTSYAAGAVVRTDGTLDGLAYATCTVGGTDATDALAGLFDRLGREDVRRVLCSGVAPAWFNLIDLPRLSAAVDRPVCAVSYEASPGLEPALRDAFDGDALDRRLATYQSLPPRRRVDTDRSAAGNEHAADESAQTADESARPTFVRSVGIGETRAATVVRDLTRDGFRRPEPVRIASVAASAHRAAVERDAEFP